MHIRSFGRESLGFLWRSIINFFMYMHYHISNGMVNIYTTNIDISRVSLKKCFSARWDQYQINIWTEKIDF